MKGTSLTVASAIVLAVIGFGPSAVVAAPQTAHEQHHGIQQTPPKPDDQGTNKMECRAVMADAHQKLSDEMSAMDAKVYDLVQAMNRATGPARIDAMAAVLIELVVQRKAMRERMTDMHSTMTGDRTRHEQADGAEAMTNCPMMKNMDGALRR